MSFVNIQYRKKDFFLGGHRWKISDLPLETPGACVTILMQPETISYLAILPELSFLGATVFLGAIPNVKMFGLVTHSI